jgi:F-type H+-transporting ATPase subunit b
VIDWFTVAAQIVNFLILIFLMKKFLYGPIIRAMDKREETIAARLNDAGQKRDEAEKEILLYNKKNEEFESHRAEMMEKARVSAEERKKELIAEARKEVDDIKERWREAVGQEKESFLRGLRERMADEIYTISRRVCSDLADVSLEDHMAEMFMKKINALDQKTRDEIINKLKDAGGKLTIATSFELTKQKKQTISETIQRIIAPGAHPEFFISKDILCGIELRAKGYAFGWNVDVYLKSLEDEFGRMIES